MWTLRFEDGERHLEQGVALARRIGRSYLELTGLAHGAHAMLLFRPDRSRPEWSRQAIELAERHGWAEESLAGMAYAQLGIVALLRGRLDEAELWLERAERTLRTEVEPAAGMSLHCARAVLDLARGRPQEALLAFGAAEKLATTLAGPASFVTSMRSRMLDTLAHSGETGRAERALAELREEEARRDREGTAAPNVTEQLTDSETRVLRYLPTHLTAYEIAAELWLSVNTVNTHTRHLYAKLGVHRRHEAVDRARALGLLAPPVGTESRRAGRTLPS
jgi:LuxR family maltose regulon positive regulatory protein